MFVLDASALRSGRCLSVDGEMATTPKILEEVKRGNAGEMVQYLIEAGLKVFSPSRDALRAVSEAAREWGEATRLSQSDIELLALALETRSTILTDDYSIQNMARVLGIDHMGIEQVGITEVWRWRAVCSGCRRVYDSPMRECPVCGSEIRSGRPTRVGRA
ncbi:MAG: hypothetical protein AB1665_00055 [Candidatus Thermoplasmatota archaeon]